MRKDILTVMLLSCLISISTVLAYEPPQKTLLIFSAEWCKYCHIAIHDINTNPKLVEVSKNYTIVELDFDIDKNLIEGYNIKTLPTFVMFEGGKEVGRQIGYKFGADGLYRFLK